MQKMQALIIKDEIFLKHDPGFGHPESQERLRAIYKRLAQPDMQAMVAEHSPRRASKEEISWNHSPAYVDRIERTAGVDHFQLDPDTSTSADSWDAACFAVGAGFEALDKLYSGEFKTAFALVRPPGHHAEYDHAMGFCLFNNAALAARYALRKKGAERVLIIDWDLHHGNGTQHSFYDDDRVLYFSTHQYPYYPGTGSAEQCGEGKGTGYTVNVPLSAGAGDQEYASIFNLLLEPIALEFAPDVVVVSAGFDIYKDDPLGGMRVTEGGFSYLAEKICKIAEKCSARGPLFCLEGGYNLSGLSQGVAAVIRSSTGNLLDEEAGICEIFMNADKKFKELEHAHKVQKRFWKNL